MPMRIYRKFDLQRIKVNWKNRDYSFQKESVTWDYCLLPFGKMKMFYKAASEIYKKSKYKFHPFVLIGH